MDLSDLGGDAPKNVEEILGYLNFASGARDARFLKNVNELFGLLEAGRDEAKPTWRILGKVLRHGLAELCGSSEAFRRVEQAEAVLGLVFDATLPAYRRQHRDLLFHQTDAGLFRPLLIGRVCEAVLQQGGPWPQTDRIVRGALSRLNDYIGHRPVAVLRTAQKIQPYDHEWVCPIPLYIRGVGAAVGPYRELIEKALEILETTDSSLLFQAFFDLDRLDELALDPRAYDFDHPVNKRPNYLFGQWDLNRLDNSGYCRRFVLQQVSLSAMLTRVHERGKLPYEEVLFEAGAVLAGTMLMGSGVSGNRPDAHDSSTTLATLVQQIAGYRDAFYEQLLACLSGPHAERLRAEAVKLRQPLGGARQHFNQHLARRRAEQLQHVHLARLFARIGYTEAATRQVQMVPVASARMQCDMHCRLSAARSEIERGQLDQAALLLPEIEDLLHRAIECGALVDPWNILGFGGQYSLFPALENSIPDHRVDELIGWIGEILDLYVQGKQEAAAVGNSELQNRLSEGLDKFARWWDQFASVEVSAVQGISGRETCQSADHVAAALRAWHEAGTAAGDIAFWRGHAEQFCSPKAYALVVQTLLEQGDRVAAMALLVDWLSQARQISLVEDDYSFHELALRWMKELWRIGDQPAGGRWKGGGRPGKRECQSAPTPPPSAFPLPPSRPMVVDRRWPLSRKFLDYLEANAEEYGEVPRFELATEDPDDGTNAHDAYGPDDLFGAAYENVTYRDGSDDGFTGEVLERGENATDFELIEETERITGRLAFLTTLAELWKSAAAASVSTAADDPERDEVLAGWLARAMIHRRDLGELLRAVHRYRIPPPRGTLEALVEYDQHRAIKEMLLEQIMATCVETADAGRVIDSARGGGYVQMPYPPTAGRPQPLRDLDDWEGPATQVLHALLRGDVAAVRGGWTELIDALLRQPLLYVALAKGGDPGRIVTSRSMQRVLRRLLTYLPRLGLLRETSRLIEVAQDMELEHPVGRDAITEFDQIFRIGCKGIVRCLVISSETWYSQTQQSDPELIDLLEQATEVLLRCWLVHSRGVRLSVLETVADQKRWGRLKRFIERYGGDLFSQHFMNLGNLRGILHQGADAWLRSLEEEPGADEELRLLSELDGPLKRGDAVHHLTLILEAVVENYPEYIDYNSVTTQSDRGEMLYTLLDFLRLQASYDRVAWNLQPVLLAHEVLVRCGRDEAAATWREAVAGRTAEIADDLLKRFARLSRRYGMRLPSVADRLGQRLIRPLTIDRLRALVRPAIDELHSGQELAALGRLEQGIAELTEEPSGGGVEAPAWLEALEEEVDQVLTESSEAEGESLDPYLRVAEVRLSMTEARQQLERTLGPGRH
jgi:hypothetical protein